MSLLRRVLRALWRGLVVIFKAFFVVMMVVFAIPIFRKPEITNAYRRNQVTQIKKEE